MSDDHVGDLLIISQISEDYYEAYVVSFDEDIEDDGIEILFDAASQRNRKNW